MADTLPLPTEAGAVAARSLEDSPGNNRSTADGPEAEPELLREREKDSVGSCRASIFAEKEPIDTPTSSPESESTTSITAETSTTPNPSESETSSSPSSSTTASTAQPASPLDDPESSRSMFDCNICLEQPEEPVVTLCGHLFCWSCLYRWLELHPEYQTCPVCKAGVTTEKVIPLYGRGKEEKDPRLRRPVSEDQSQVPRRPAAQRTEPVHQFPPGAPFGFFPPHNGPFATAQMGNFSFSAGFSIFPSLLGLQFMNHSEPNGPHQRGAGTPGSFTAEEQQAFLSRMLFMLGTVVVVFLLLFN